MNPYASHLGDLEPLPVLSATAARLAEFLQILGPEGTDRAPAAGKWSARDIVCHLADCEVVFAFRLRQAAAQPHHVIQPFDQDEWAKIYSACPAATALEVFRAVRRWNLALLQAVPAETFARTLNHPERGDMTFQTVVETMAGHDRNHLKQLEALAADKQ